MTTAEEMIKDKVRVLSSTIREELKVMVESGVGATLVKDDEDVVGI